MCEVNTSSDAFSRGKADAINDRQPLVYKARNGLRWAGDNSMLEEPEVWATNYIAGWVLGLDS